MPQLLVREPRDCGMPAAATPVSATNELSLGIYDGIPVPVDERRHPSVGS